MTFLTLSPPPPRQVYRRDFASKPGLANEELVRNVGTLGASAQLVSASRGWASVSSLAQIPASSVAASFGTMITVLVYGLAPVSGGHINPAISISLARHWAGHALLLACCFG